MLLRWALQQGVAVIPKSVSEGRMEENAAVMSPDFTLTDEDMKALTSMDQVSQGNLAMLMPVSIKSGT